MAQINAGAGANGDIFAQDIAKNTDWSNFDLSRITNLTGDTGMIIPFDWFETIPKDRFKISAEVALESLPTITNMLTPYHVRTHWYYVRNSDLWAGFETMITKGRTGNLNWTIPQINIDQEIENGKFTWSVPHSLQTFLGLAPKYGKNINENDTRFLDDYLSWGYSSTGTVEQNYTKTGYEQIKDGVSALPFMAYQAICKYNYCDQNLLTKNYSLFPEEGDSDWRIPAKGNPTYINKLRYVDNQIKAVLETSEKAGNGIYQNNDTEGVALQALRYAQYEDDAFTTALPWPQRGNAETLDTELDLSNLEITTTLTPKATANLKVGYRTTDGTGQITKTGYIGAGGSGTIKDINDNTQIANGSQIYTILEGEETAKTIRANSIVNNTRITSGTSITANDLRKLIAMSVWQERNAQVNGSYNSMIWIHYKHNPKAQEHYPVYIGGTSDYIKFNEIMSTVETEDNPQGTITSNGKMYLDQDVGAFECPDYGIIMGILIITPMTTYNTTTQKEFFKKTAEDFYFPEFDNLGAMPILNKEIYTKGDTQTDNGLFGYAKNRYYWMKTRQNANRGLFQMKSTYSTGADAKDSYFSAGTQAREFGDTPILSNEFKTINALSQRRDWLAFPKEPMFKIQVASKIKAERPMAYNTQPETFGF